MLVDLTKFPPSPNHHHPAGWCIAYPNQIRTLTGNIETQNSSRWCWGGFAIRLGGDMDLQSTQLPRW